VTPYRTVTAIAADISQIVAKKPNRPSTQTPDTSPRAAGFARCRRPTTTAATTKSSQATKMGTLGARTMVSAGPVESAA
jgi:hypothetical protein